MSIIKTLNRQSLAGIASPRLLSVSSVPQGPNQPTWIGSAAAVAASAIVVAFGCKHFSRGVPTMDDISNIHYGPLPADSPYVKPFRFHYTQNGKEKSWDLLKVHDSVSIVIWNVTRQKLVMVKQFRPAVYHGLVSADAGTDGRNIDMKKYPPSLAVTLELCAGIVDKPISLAEIAKEEVLEECGYDVPVERLEEIISYRSGVGTSGSLQVMFYVEVTDDDKIHTAGGGVEDEIIEVVEYTLEDAWKLMEKGSVLTSPPAFLFGVLWFLTNRAPKLTKA